MSVKQADTSREVLNTKGIAGQVDIYPGMVHGFACRGDLSKAEVKVSLPACYLWVECLHHCRRAETNAQRLQWHGLTSTSLLQSLQHRHHGAVRFRMIWEALRL